MIKINWKHILAFVLNLLILPGAGVWMLGKGDLAKFHMIGWVLSALLISSGGFGLTGTLATIIGFVGIAGLFGSWVWSNYTLFVMIDQKYK
ncbi:hypothetical protein COV11_03460 [Candidatus Woesearchaeota archaeon CG10_big_fil_rev_8_21_14_0_10_30_7]|nr:MAG: hypothetical protein COV11_03460 [Candidatus Woesearchaeota archaeon CG10_big_fil_rev_8_21_14_0_10_30_7]